ncbi:MAG: hypothetical protein ACPL5I_16985 [Thermodesulfobacteriota bacterium]
MELAKLKEEIRRLKMELQEKEKALPAHSITPYQMQFILELEEKIKELEGKLKIREGKGERI